MKKETRIKYFISVSLLMLWPGIAYSQQAPAPNVVTTQNVSISTTNGTTTAKVNGVKVTVPYNSNGVYINTLNKGVGVFVSGIQTSP